MIKKLPDWCRFSYLWPYLFLTLLVGILAWKNYTPGTWLSGWDTLHPEFNFSLYIKRCWFGAWQQHQGLGAPAAQAAAAELFRLPVVWVLMHVLPIHMIRYGFMWVTWLVGVLGMYIWIQYLCKDSKVSKEISCFAALFYLLNPVTMQQYVVPLEMFAVQFAVLPWLFYFITRWLQEHKNLGWMACTIILAAPMAHTATLWYITFGLMSVYGLIISYKKKERVTRWLVLLGLIVGLNMYWLGPNLYYLFTNASVVEQSTISRLFSEEAFLQGKAYGNWQFLYRWQNFLFNWRVWDFSSGQIVQLLYPWAVSLSSLPATVLFGGAWLMTFLGLTQFIHRKHRYIILGLVVVMACGVMFLLSATPGIEGVFAWLRMRSSIFREGLRFPFTKLSFITIFSVISVMGFGLDLIWKNKSVWIVRFGLLLISGLNIWVMKPAFFGQMISPHVRVAIPHEYFELFDFFQHQSPVERIAKFPLSSQYGWDYYQWGYQGAGFEWFGLPQPYLNREFDRWGKFNEDFYTSAKQAVLDKNVSRLQDLLSRYNVVWMIVDSNSFIPGSNQDNPWLTASDTLLSDMSSIRLVRTFGGIRVYRVEQQLQPQVISNPSHIQLPSVYEGQSLYTVGTQATVSEDKTAPTFPFLSWEKRSGMDYSVVGSELNLSRLWQGSQPVSLSIPEMNELLANVSSKSGDIVVTPVLPTINGVTDQKTEYVFPKSSQAGYIAVGNYWIDASVLATSPATVQLTPNSAWQTFSFATRQQEPVMVTMQQDAPHLCANPQISVEEGDTFQVKDKAVCKTALLQLSRPALVRLSSQDQRASWCVSSQNDPRCIPALISGNDHTESAWNLKPGTYWIDEVFESRGLTYEVSQHHVHVMTNDVLVSNVEMVTPADWFLMSSHNLGNVHDVSVQYPLRLISSWIPANDEDKQVMNCDVLKAGEAHRWLDGVGNVVYSASGQAASCDAATFMSVPPKPLLVVVRGHHLYGRSEKIYLSWDDGLEQNEYLLPVGAFNTALYLPPRMDGKKHALTVHLETRSFGNQGGSVVIKEISLFELPEWVAQIRLSEDKRALHDEILTNNQGYDMGWLAWYQGKLLKHVRVNGWQNGWEIPGNSEQGIGDSKKIKIMYWPQYLEWIGFGVMGIVMVVLVCTHRRKDAV